MAAELAGVPLDDVQPGLELLCNGQDVRREWVVGGDPFWNEARPFGLEFGGFAPPV